MHSLCCLVAAWATFVQAESPICGSLGCSSLNAIRATPLRCAKKGPTICKECDLIEKLEDKHIGPVQFCNTMFERISSGLELVRIVQLHGSSSEKVAMLPMDYESTSKMLDSCTAGTTFDYIITSRDGLSSAIALEILSPLDHTKCRARSTLGPLKLPKGSLAFISIDNSQSLSDFDIKAITTENDNDIICSRIVCKKLVEKPKARKPAKPKGPPFMVKSSAAVKAANLMENLKFDFNVKNAKLIKEEEEEEEEPKDQNKSPKKNPRKKLSLSRLSKFLKRGGNRQEVIESAGSRQELTKSQRIQSSLDNIDDETEKPAKEKTKGVRFAS